MGREGEREREREKERRERERESQWVNKQMLWWSAAVEVFILRL